MTDNRDRHGDREREKDKPAPAGRNCANVSRKIRNKRERERE